MTATIVLGWEKPLAFSGGTVHDGNSQLAALHLNHTSRKWCAPPTYPHGTVIGGISIYGPRTWI